VDGEKIYFTLARPCHISVEINRNIKRPLFMFADPPEPAPPDRAAGNLYFFEGGKVHNTRRTVLKDNDIVYIEGGAVVKGSFFLDGVRNVHIFGYGILDGEFIYSKGEERMIEINRSENIRVEGIIINESKHWTAPCNLSTYITYKNVKIISGNDWDDGIDIVSSRHVLVDGCFIRTKDDCIAIKAGVTYYTDFYNQYNTEDVQVVNSVMWNAEWGNGLEIGFETRSDTIRDILFRNIDLIHVEGPEGTFTIHNGDRATVSNVLYEDIRVEDSRGLLVDFKILESRYSRDKERGHIGQITFRNIEVTGEMRIPSLFLGYDPQHVIGPVVFENFRIQGSVVKSLLDLKAKTEYAAGISFR
jgi:polygalacturonase